MEPTIPAGPDSGPRFPSTFRLAVALCLGTLALFVVVGMPVQALNVAFGIWFTEVFIFLGLPWVALRLTGRDPVRFVGLRFSGLAPAGYGFLVGAVNFFAVVVPVQFLAQSVAPEWLRELYDASQLFRRATPVELTLIIAAVGVAAPLCEEYFFRGVFQRGLTERRLSPAGAIVVSGVVFSAFHFDPVGFLARFELGVLFGLLYWRSGSIWPGVMAHSANNLVSSALFFASGGVEAEAQEPDPLAILLLAAVGLAALAWVTRLALRRPELLLAREPAAEVPDPRRASFGAIIRPWAALAILSALALLAMDHRGVRLSLVDVRYPLGRLEKDAPAEAKAERDALDELRRRARAGEVPIDEYVERRRRAAEGARPPVEKQRSRG